MELFIFLSQKTLMTKLWSTPYGLKFMPYGVLHMASKSNHMEYSIWQYIESFGVDSKALHMTSEKRHMEYSIWSLFDAIWSTPCGHYFLPYGVLHMVTVEFIFSRGCPICDLWWMFIFPNYVTRALTEIWRNSFFAAYITKKKGSKFTQKPCFLIIF